MNSTGLSRRTRELTNESSRMQMEEDHFDQQIKMQGLTFNKTVAEDERKQLHTSGATCTIPHSAGAQFSLGSVP